MQPGEAECCCSIAEMVGTARIGFAEISILAMCTACTFIVPYRGSMHLLPDSANADALALLHLAQCARNGSGNPLLKTTSVHRPP